MSVQKKLLGRRVRWDVRWREAGHQHSRSFDRKADADRFDLEKRRERQLGRYAPRPRSQATVGSVLDDWLAWQIGEKAPSTIYQRRTVLKRRLREYAISALPVAELTRRDVISWLDELRADGASAIERNRAKSALSACLSWAADRELVDSNPILGMKNTREPKPERTALTPLAVERIRAEMPDATGRALVSVLGWCGLRVSEGLALEPGDIRPGRLRIRRTLSLGEKRQTKTGHERIVPLLDPVKADLEAALPDLFDGITWSPWLRDVWHPARERAKIPHVTPASLRHTFATLMLYSGAPLHAVGEALGHSSPTTTLTWYAHTHAEAKYEPRRDLATELDAARRAAGRGDEGDDYLIGF